MPARLTTSRASYSKNLMRRGSLYAERTPRRPRRTRVRSHGGRLEAVGLGQLRVLAGKHFGEVDHHLALLPSRIVLHLAVDHVHAPPVWDRLDHLLREGDLLGVRRED